MPNFKKNTSPAMKRSAYKMKGMDFGNSPLADKGEVVSKTSPGPGWTKTKGTNIWAPPTGEMGYSQKMTKLKRKPVEKKRTITDKTEMKPPYARPTGPRA